MTEPSDDYGRILTVDDLRIAIEDTLKLWLPAYIAEVASQNDIPRANLPMIRGWSEGPDPDRRVEDQLPAIQVIIPGTAATPERLSDTVGVMWAASVGVTVSGMDDQSTAALCGYYTGAIRAAIIHHQSLGGFAQSAEWIGEVFDTIGTIEERTLRVGIVQFNVMVEKMTQRYGPVMPPVDPIAVPEPWPVVTSVDESVEMEA